MPQVGEIRSNPNNPTQRARWDGRRWVDASSGPASVDMTAPGAVYLPPKAMGTDKSEDAYYREWRQKDPMAGNQAISQARQGLVSAQRAESLLKRQKTGGIYSVPFVGPVAGWFDPEIRELDAIQSRQARQERQPGEGAISDFDAQQFLAMTYGKDKPTDTNRALIQAQRLAADAVIQRRQFGEWWRMNYGSLTGFEEAWDRYSQDNPIFDFQAGQKGVPKLNTGRQTWRSYFGAGGDPRGSAAARDAATASGGKAGVGRTPQDPVDLSKGQSRAGLSRGVFYRDAQGNVRRNDNADRGNPIVVPAQKQPKAQGQGWKVISVQ